SLRKTLQELIAQHVTLLEPQSTFDLLTLYDIPLLPYKIVQVEIEAKRAGEELNVPLAMKIISPDISHKTEMGGVLLNVNPKETEAAFRTIMENMRTHAP